MARTSWERFTQNNRARYAFALEALDDLYVAAVADVLIPDVDEYPMFRRARLGEGWYSDVDRFVERYLRDPGAYNERLEGPSLYESRHVQRLSHEFLRSFYGADLRLKNLFEVEEVSFARPYS